MQENKHTSQPSWLSCILTSSYGQKSIFYRLWQNFTPFLCFFVVTSCCWTTSGFYLASEINVWHPWTNENWWYSFFSIWRLVEGASWVFWPLKVVHRCESERQCVFCLSVSALWGTAVHHHLLRYETSDSLFFFLLSTSIAIISFWFFFYFLHFISFIFLFLFIYFFQFLTEPCCLRVHKRNRGFLTPVCCFFVLKILASPSGITFCDCFLKYSILLYILKMQI